MTASTSATPPKPNEMMLNSMLLSDQLWPGNIWYEHLLMCDPCSGL